MFRFFENLTNPFPEDSSDIPIGKKLFQFCFGQTSGFRGPLILVTITSGAVAAFEVVLFAFLGNIVDWLVVQDKSTFLLHEKSTLIWMSLVALVFLPIVTVFTAWGRNQSIMGNFPMAIRWRIHSRLLEQSMSFYQEEFSGRISTKLMQTALATRDVVLKFADIFVYIATYIISMFILLVKLDPILALPLICWAIFYAMIQVYLNPKLVKVSRAQSDARSTMTGRVVDAYTNITTVKLFAHTDEEKKYAKESMGDFLKTAHEQFRLVTSLDVSISIGNYLLIYASGAVGIYAWLQGNIQVGSIAVAVALAMRVSAMSHWLMYELAALFEFMGVVSDGMEMLARPVTVKDKPDAKELVVSKGSIDFRDICFSYRPQPNSTRDALDIDEGVPQHSIVLEHLNLSISPGEKIGLVGRSGAGKSTLVSALLRFYDVSSGSIEIDGQNIADVTQDSLRRHIAMVTQDTSLLHRTIRENILYGRPNATEEELKHAIKLAHVADFIDDLVDAHGARGLDAQVGERGVKLSGGQRQRIAIARVLLKDAPILILDEATSALDSEVEAAIQESLMRLMEGKTVIAIAHRLSTIAQMDRLVIMEKGAIVEQGTHEELLVTGGIYSQLWSRQTGGYIEC